MRRAQTATEYLVILAVVIVMGVIAVGVMGGIPSLGGGASESAAKAELATLSVGIADYAQDSRATTLKFKNNNPGLIRIDDIWIDGKRCTLYPYQAKLRGGEQRRIECYGVVGLDENTRFDHDFNLTYTDMKTEAQYVIDPEVDLVGMVAEGAELHTGQTQCYDISQNYGEDEIDCSDPNAGGDAFYDGTAKSFTDVGDNVVRDDHTGLYWTTNETADVTLAEAYSDCAARNIYAQGGFSDWRLPNINELITAIDYGATGENPTPNGEWTEMTSYWSSTSQSDSYYWYLSGDGRIGEGSGDSVVCVRGETASISLKDTGKNFADVGDGTVVDLDNGLVWQQGDSSEYAPFAGNCGDGSDGCAHWNESIAYCEQLSLGGFTDWRLPTVIEAALFMDYDTSDRINDVFSTTWDYYNTATTDDFVSYVFAPADGWIDLLFKESESFDYARVRCVRDHD